MSNTQVYFIYAAVAVVVCVYIWGCAFFENLKIKERALVEAIQAALDSERCDGMSCPKPTQQICTNPTHEILREALKAWS